MTQPAQPSQTAPPAAPAAPQGQPAQQPPSQPPAQPAPQHTQQPQTWPGYVPQVPPQQQPTAPTGWPQPQVPAQPPAQQPYQMPALPAAWPPPPPATADDDGQYDLARLPKGARDEIERLRAQNQQHTTQLRTAAVSQQAWVIAPQLNVNPAALIGSLDWQQAAAQLDPNAADYAQRLAWTIQAISGRNPWMAATPAAQPGQPPAPQGQPGQPGYQPSQPPAPTAPAAPARSGGEFTGAPAAGAPPVFGSGLDRLRHAYSQQT